MKNIFLVPLFLFSKAIFSQNNICSLNKLEKNTINCLTENPNIGLASSENIRKITQQIYIAPNFIYKNCNDINNALAVINPINNKRYIMFDFEYLNNISNNDYWFKIFVLAHEIAHHLNGHTIPDKETTSILISQQKELDCDYFAGYILYKLGASENQIFTIFNNLPDPKNEYSSHPRNYKRIDYTLKGYKNEFNKFKKLLDQNSEKLYSKFKNEELNKKYKDFIKYVDDYTKTENKKSLEIAAYLLESLTEINNSDFNEIKAFINYESENYELALPFYKTNLYKGNSSSNLIYYLSILDKLNLSDESIEMLSINDIKDPEILLNLGIYYSKRNNREKSFQLFKRAYEIIADEEDSLLKSDILISYARVLYEEQIELHKTESDKMNFNLSKSKFYEAKKIILKYPNDKNYRLYYNTLLFHLGGIAEIEKNWKAVEKNCSELITRIENKEDKTDRIDFLYKSHFRLYQCYLALGKKQQAIQSITYAINSCDSSEMKGWYLNRRGLLYVELDEMDLAFKDLEYSCKLNFKSSCESLKMKK